MIKINYQKGYSLPEIIITVTILTLIIASVGIFQLNIFSMNRVIQTGINNQYRAKKIITPFSNEVRGAVSSDTGSYPIEMAGTSTFIFYSNIDNDSKIERIKYYLDGTNFKRTVLKSSGDPLEYNENNEESTQVIHDVIPNSIFEYYDSNYDGTASSTPLSFPVNPSDVRLIKVILQIDNDQNNPPNPMVIETQVSVRNLKDNR